MTRARRLESRCRPAGQLEAGVHQPPSRLRWWCVSASNSILLARVNDPDSASPIGQVRRGGACSAARRGESSERAAGDAASPRTARALTGIMNPPPPFACPIPPAKRSLALTTPLCTRWRARAALECAHRIRGLPKARAAAAAQAKVSGLRAWPGEAMARPGGGQRDGKPVAAPRVTLQASPGSQPARALTTLIPELHQ